MEKLLQMGADPNHRTSRSVSGFGFKFKGLGFRVLVCGGALRYRRSLALPCAVALRLSVRECGAGRWPWSLRPPITSRPA